MELEHYGLRRTYRPNKLCVRPATPRRLAIVSVVNKLDCHELLTTRRLDVTKFSKCRVWDKVPQESTHNHEGRELPSTT